MSDDDRYNWPQHTDERTRRLGRDGPIQPAAASVTSWPTPENADDLDAEQLLRRRLQQRLGELYTIEEEIGRGGMAIVFRARELASSTAVALKVVRGDLVRDPETRARFEREAKLTRELDHPSIVRTLALHDISPHGLVIAMEFVSGGTLKQRLRREGRLPIPDVVSLITAIAGALDCAHERGIVHRDLKPENVFLDGSTGSAKLGDFGIARGNESDNLTMTGTAIGTPAYMSPEAIDGRHIDHRTDLYSLGLVAWEALTGSQPWAGESLYSVIYKQKHETLPDPRSLRSDAPSAVCDVISALLAKSPNDRPPTAQAVLQRLGHPEVLPRRKPQHQLGVYAIEEEIGRGEVAVVFRARDVASGIAVALKVVQGDRVRDPETRARFEREMKLTRDLNHPNIVQALSLNDSSPSGLSLAMEFVSGGTLRKRLLREGRLPIPDVVRLVNEIAGALDYLHLRGIIHRDVTPENILFDGISGSAKLGNFGIARAGGESDFLPAGCSIGTPAYMSPEAVDGRHVDHRTDLYSLGLVAWEALAGPLPWAVDSVWSVLQKQKHVTLSDPRSLRKDVPAALCEVIAALLAKAREDRPLTAKSVQEKLVALRASGGKAAQPKVVFGGKGNASTPQSLPPRKAEAPRASDAGGARKSMQATSAGPSREGVYAFLIVFAPLAIALIVANSPSTSGVGSDALVVPAVAPAVAPEAAPPPADYSSGDRSVGRPRTAQGDPLGAGASRQQYKTAKAAVASFLAGGEYVAAAEIVNAMSEDRTPASVKARLIREIRAACAADIGQSSCP